MPRQPQPQTEQLKPIVVVSQCLGFAAVRYNGAMLQDDFVRALRNHVKFVQVCPEVGIGLGVPRDPIRIVCGPSGRTLFQPATGRDVTEPMRQFSTNFFDTLGPVDGFILKSRSPSCGVKDVKVFSPSGDPMPKSTGLFAEAVMARFPGCAVEDEGRLTNFRLRHHFLVRLYASAAFREVKTPADLVQFHTAYKLQWMAYSHTGLNQLGRIVANPQKLPIGKLLTDYATPLGQMLSNPPRPSNTRNALLHAFGYVSAGLSPAERKHFLELLEDYRQERLPLSVLLTLLASWVVRFEQPYLAGQKFFQPYPKALMDLGDSGK